MLNKTITALIATAVALPTGSYVIDQVKPESEYFAVYHSIDTTLINAMAINQINPTTSIEEALQRAVEENRKAEGMTQDGTYVYYTVGDTCLKGKIIEDYTLIIDCKE